MKNLVKSFLRDEQGQDLVEYSLLLAFVCLASAALFVNAGTGINTIWTQGNILVSQAASAATKGAS